MSSICSLLLNCLTKSFNSNDNDEANEESNTSFDGDQELVDYSGGDKNSSMLRFRRYLYTNTNYFNNGSKRNGEYQDVNPSYMNEYLKLDNYMDIRISKMKSYQRLLSSIKATSQNDNTMSQQPYEIKRKSKHVYTDQLNRYLAGFPVQGKGVAIADLPLEQDSAYWEIHIVDIIKEGKEEEKDKKQIDSSSEGSFQNHIGVSELEYGFGIGVSKQLQGDILNRPIGNISEGSWGIHSSDIISLLTTYHNLLYKAKTIESDESNKVEEGKKKKKEPSAGRRQ